MGVSLVVPAVNAELSVALVPPPPPPPPGLPTHTARPRVPAPGWAVTVGTSLPELSRRFTWKARYAVMRTQPTRPLAIAARPSLKTPPAGVNVEVPAVKPPSSELLVPPPPPAEMIEPSLFTTRSETVPSPLSQRSMSWATTLGVAIQDLLAVLAHHADLPRVADLAHVDVPDLLVGLLDGALEEVVAPAAAVQAVGDGARLRSPGAPPEREDRAQPEPLARGQDLSNRRGVH